MRWIRQNKEDFPTPTAYKTNPSGLSYHQNFSYQDASQTDLAEIKRQLKATRFELQVLTNQNQELLDMLHDIIAAGQITIDDKDRPGNHIRNTKWNPSCGINGTSL
jgi:hypothetical protein